MPIEKRKNWFIERNFNTHNQYIDITISYGIIGLLIFLVFVKETLKFSLKNIHSLNLVLSLLYFTCRKYISQATRFFHFCSNFSFGFIFNQIEK